MILLQYFCSLMKIALKKAIRIKSAEKAKKCVLPPDSPRFSQPPSKHNMQYRSGDNTPYQLSGGIKRLQTAVHTGI